MHKYMRAIGFSEYTERKKISELLKKVINDSDRRAYALNSEEVMLGDFCKNFAPNLGIQVCGEFDEEDKFVYEYYFPYLNGEGISTCEDVSVERHAARESYAGVVDDIKVGITVIFALQNRIPYVNAKNGGLLPVKGTSVTLSGLSTEGTIMMPLLKNAEKKEKIEKDNFKRVNLIEKALKGDEEALGTLTLEDMDIYYSLSKRMENEDLYSVVDTSFMPYGVECDQYSILGDITQVRIETNQITDEKIYILTVACNDLTFDIAINIIDLFGEPEVGRRFKGVVWMQGNINFPLT